MTTTTASSAVPGYVRATQWIWLAGSAVSVLGVIVALAMAPVGIAWMMFALTAVQAAVAIPAAIALPRGKRWARVVLMVLAVLSIGSLYSAFQMGNWGSLVLNVVLASTFGLLQDASAREFFGLPARGKRSFARG